MTAKPENLNAFITRQFRFLFRYLLSPMLFVLAMGLTGCNKKSDPSDRIRELEGKLKESEDARLLLQTGASKAKAVQSESNAQTSEQKEEGVEILKQSQEKLADAARLAELQANRKAVITVVRRIQSKCSVGINVAQYSNALLEAKPDFDLATSLLPQGDDARFHCENAFDAHICALEYWTESIQPGKNLTEIPRKKFTKYKARGLSTDSLYFKSSVTEFWVYANSELAAAVSVINLDTPAK